MSDRKTAQKPVVDSHSPATAVTRPFHKTLSGRFSALALSSTLAFGGFTASMLMPKDARAQDDIATIGGVKAQKEVLPNTIAKLMEQSKRYSQGESNFVLSNGTNAYGNMLLRPHSFKASIVLTSDSADFGLEFTKGKGKEEGGFPSFKKAVEQATGKKWERAVMFIVFEKAPDTNEDVTTAYALAADKDGAPIKYNGNYVGLGGSYYTQQGLAGIGAVVVSEPSNVSKR